MYKVELRKRLSASTSGATSPFPGNSPVFCVAGEEPAGGEHVRALTGKFTGSHRYRVGDLRVVYTVNDQAVTVFVITIAKRSDAYE